MGLNTGHILMVTAMSMEKIITMYHVQLVMSLNVLQSTWFTAQSYSVVISLEYVNTHILCGLPRGHHKYQLVSLVA